MSAVVIGVLGWVALLLMIAGVFQMLREAQLEQRRTLRRMMRNHVHRR